MFNQIEKVLMPVADKLGKNRVLCAIRDGFLISTPLLIVGSIFMLIAKFPITGWAEFWAGILGDDWQSWFTNVSNAIYSITGLFTCLGTGYAFSREMKCDKIAGAAVSLVAYFILMPKAFAVEGTSELASGLSFEYIGSNGIFIGLVSSLVAVLLFSWTYRKGWTIKMPRGVPPTVCDSFAALIPTAVVMLSFFFIRLGFELTPFETAHNFVLTILQEPMKGMGNTLAANAIYSFACTILWFFGINGPAVANSVYFIGKVLTIEQQNAFIAGQSLPYIFTDPFSNFFTGFGGGGSTLSLVIVMLLFCKSERITKLGKLSIIPGIFGINEPIIFGLPIVLNPVIIIPFVLVPLMNLVLSYYATLWEIIPRTTGVSLPWTTPIGFSGYLSTGSFIASIWQIGLLVLGCFVYYPFIRALDRQYLKEEAQAVDEVDSIDEMSFDDLSFDDL